MARPRPDTSRASASASSPDFTNTGAATLNVNGIGAKAIQLAAAALTGGEIVAGQMVTVAYDGTQFQITALPGHYRGGLIGIQTFGTAGTFTYTPTVGTNSVVVELVGAGGGGGGCALLVAPSSDGRSRGAGGYVAKRITASFSGVTVTVGAKGTGGTAGANAERPAALPVSAPCCRRPAAPWVSAAPLRARPPPSSEELAASAPAAARTPPEAMAWPLSLRQ